MATEKTITKTTTEVRNVFTLMTDFGDQHLSRRFEGHWVADECDLRDPNAFGREVEQEFAKLCRDWGIAEQTALSVFQIEKRQTRYVEEIDIDATERSRHVITVGRSQSEDS
jgi:hypothetical protein